MDRSLDNTTAKSERLIRVTPDQLRSIANQMESMAKHGSLPGEAVLVGLTRGVTLIYDPLVTRHTIASQPAVLEGGNA